jgi:acyl-CoA thioesterase FadM
MNLFFRLIFTFIMSRFRSRVFILDECHTPFRVLPTDLDIFRHINNGIYFSLQDLARTDLMIRSGFWKKINNKGWYPVVASEFIRFKRSLSIGETFEISTKVVGWDERYFFLEHKFLKGSVVCAQGFVKTRFLSKKGEKIKPIDLLILSNIQKDQTQLPLFIKEWEHIESYSSQKT